MWTNFVELDKKKFQPLRNFYFRKSYTGWLKLGFLILKLCSINTKVVVESCYLKMIFLMFLKVSKNSRESICVGVLFSKNRLIKKNPTQVFSCEFCKIFKNTYFEEPLTANGFLLICFIKITHLPQRYQKR